ncbi:hypothetical protein M3Y97_01168500 [Aphelenchoides bicaudatus]|nr:hypothetical protein M3Y97_01168500 [Aphelenchoides bicaudatus]
MELTKNVQILIRQQIILGNSLAETILNLNEAIKNDLTKEQIEEWLKCIDEQEALSEINLSLESTQLLNYIYQLFKKLKPRVSKKKCQALECKRRILSSRYALDLYFKDDQPVFALIDLIYGEERTLTSFLNNKVFGDDQNECNLRVLDAEYFLFFSQQTQAAGNVYSSIFLLKIDYKRFACKLLDQYKIYTDVCEFVFDSSDPRSFAFFTNERGMPLFLGNVSEDCLNLRHVPHCDNMYPDYQTFWLIDNNLYAVNFSHGIWIKKVALNEQDFLNQIDKDENYGASIQSNLLQNAQVLWFVKSFVLCSFRNNSKTQLIKFDLNAHEIKLEIPLNFHEIIDFCVDNNESVLTVCARRLNSKQHVVQRFLLKDAKEPISLLNLSLQSIGQNSLFLNEDQYEHLLKKLPPKFQPFENIFVPNNKLTKEDLISKHILENPNLFKTADLLNLDD